MANPSQLPHLILDANAILRYLRNDIPAQANAVRERLVHAQAGRLIFELYPLVFAEVFFVLESFYKVPRETIVSVLTIFLDTPGIKMHEEKRVRESLDRYIQKNVSFVDAYLATLAAEKSCPIFSFDKGLDKFKDVRRLEK